jgi:hypothetical protein
MAWHVALAVLLVALCLQQQAQHVLHVHLASLLVGRPSSASNVPWANSAMSLE